MSRIESAVLLNDFCHVQGGASRVAIDEAVGLAERGVKVTFLGATGPVGPELKASSVETICLEQPELAEVASHPGVALQGLWNITAARRMRAILARHDPSRTIVHLHGYTKSLSTSPLRAAVAADFPIVATLHDYFAMCPSGNYYDYVREAPCRLQPLSVQCATTNCDKRGYSHKLYRVARGALQHWPGRMPTGINDFIALSAGSGKLLRPHLTPRARIHWLPNIIDVAPLAPVDAGANTALTYVGRLDPEKGVQALLDAANRVDAALVFVGDGPLRGAVAAPGRHRVTGWQDAAGVRACLRAARCLVFPSQWHETFGMVVSEAAANGVPAIVSDISAAAERVRDGVTGMVFPAGNVAALATCLARTTDSAWMSQIGRNAYADFWSAPPTRDRHITGLLRIYAAVFAARPWLTPQLSAAR
jgi:glycosyltransferase involved in cell wall biosynthesis